MDKSKRQKRVIQKKRNLTKWVKREQVKKKMWSNPTSNAPLTESDERRARINANHGKRCSCDGCGNQRRAFGRKNPTMQEKKANSMWIDWFDGF